MVTESEYIDATIELEVLIKELDSGKNVDDRLNAVSDIIEEYEHKYYPISST